MDDKLVTTNIILDALKGWVESKHPIPPSLFLDACMKLMILMSDETDKLYLLEQQIASLKVAYIEGGKTVAAAESYVKSTDLYRQMKQQTAKIKQIEEAVRISKIQARLRNDEINHQ